MKVLLLCWGLLLALCVAAQEKNSIQGKAVQHGTGTPLTNASVFISGSSIGTVTDSAGNFELKGIPAGSFELVVSSVGYETLVYSFTSGQLPLKLSLQLQPKVQELETVTVEPWDPNGWANWGLVFQEYFLGTTPAAKLCRILNKETLRFKYNSKTKVLTVVADEPLQIENNFLGYNLQYQLEDFTLDQKAGAILFVGYSLYKDMAKKGKRIPQRYNKRRQDTYKGSMSHFMRALYHDSLAEQGFDVRRMHEEPNYEKDRVRKAMASRMRNRISSGGKAVLELGVKTSDDTLKYYQQVMGAPDMTRHVGDHALKADSLLTPGKGVSKQLYFSNYLQIIYKKKLEDIAYVQSRWSNRKPGYPVSHIFLSYDMVINIEPNGYYYPPQAIFTLDYWGWSEKISHMLPLDYMPPGNNN
jgi:hypothetical protein